MRTQTVRAFVLSLVLSAIAFTFTVVTACGQTVISKANNGTAINLAGSWQGGVVPTGTDVARWHNPPTAAGTTAALGGNVTFGQIQILNPGGAAVISATGGSALTLNGIGGLGIDMRGASQALAASCAVTLGGPQTWDFGPATLTQTGAIDNNGNTLTLHNATGPTLSAAISGGGGLRSRSWGTVTLSGANTYAGATTIGAVGTLLLDFSAATAPANNIINNAANNSALVFDAAGTLNVKGKSGATITQQFNGLTVNGGGAVVSNNVNGASSQTLSLGAIACNNNASVDFQRSAAGPITTTSASLGLWATFDGASDFAVVSGGNITALSAPITPPASWSGGDYSYDTSGTTTLNTPQSANTLRTLNNTANTTLTINSTTLTLNGLLHAASSRTLTVSASGSGTVAIGSSGNLRVGGRGLIWWSTGTSLILISAPISGTGNLIKIGPDGLQLNAVNTFTGSVIHNSGALASSNGLGFGSTNNVIVLQGGSRFGWYNSQGGGFYRYARYNGMTWAADFSFADPVNNGGTLDFNGTPTTIVGGTRIVNVDYTGVLLDGPIGDGGNGYGITKRTGGGALWLLGPNTYSGPTTLMAGTVYADKSRIAAGNSNFVLQGGSLAPAFSPDFSFTLGTGAGEVQFIPGLNATLAASPYSRSVVNFNNGATLTMSSTPYFLLGPTVTLPTASRVLTFNSSNTHAVYWKNPIQLTFTGGGIQQLDVASGAQGGYDGFLLGDISQASGVNGSLRVTGTGAIVLAGTWNGAFNLNGGTGSGIVPTRKAALPPSAAGLNNSGYKLMPRGGSPDGWTTTDVNTLMGWLGNNTQFGMDVGAAPFTLAINGLGNGSGTRSFDKFGMGTLTLTGTANYTGLTWIRHGALALNAANNISSSLTMASGTRLDNVSGGAINLAGKTLTLATTGYNYFAGNGNIRLPSGLTVTPGANVNCYFSNLGSAQVEWPGVTVGAGNAQYYVFSGANMFDYADGNGLNGGRFSVSNLTCNAGLHNTFVCMALGASLTLPGATTVTSGTNVFWVNSGTMTFDYANNASSKFGAAAKLRFGGGEARLQGHASTAVSESLSTSGFSLGWPANDSAGSGGSRLSVLPANNGGNVTLALGAISRLGATSRCPVIDFNPVNAGTAVATITTTSVNSGTTGIIGYWATYQRDTWAYASGTSPYTIAGRTAFDLVDKFVGVGTTNCVNITGNYAADPGANVNQNAIRIAAGASVTLDGLNRTYTANGTLIRGASDTDTTLNFSGGGTHTINSWYVHVNSTLADAVTPGRFVYNAPLANGALIKAGPGTLRLTQTSASVSQVNLNEGTIELAADNAVGTGNLFMGDLSGQSGFLAVGAPRTFQNNTTTSGGWYGGGLRGVRFSGTNDFTVTGVWQTTDQSGGAIGMINMDGTCNVVFQTGASSTNRPGLLVVGDTNTGGLIITGNGSGTLRFANPVLRAAAGGGGVIHIQRSDGVVQMDKGCGALTVNVNKGALIVKGTAYAPIDRIKYNLAYSNQGTTMTVSDACGLAVGMAINSFTETSIGCHITAIAGNTLTMSRQMTATRLPGANMSLQFQGIGPAGTRQTYVAGQGVLGLGANIPVPPTLTSLSCGTIGIEMAGYSQDLDMATYGNGEMYLGSATTGSITGGTLLPGIHNTYRLGGGGGTLTFAGANVLTGTAGVIVGSASLFKGATTEIVLAGNQSYTGTTAVNAGQLTIDGALEGDGSSRSSMVVGDGDVEINGKVSLDNLTFTGTGVVTVNNADGVNVYLRVNQANYSTAEAQADITAGRVVDPQNGTLSAITVVDGGVTYTMIRPASGTLIILR